MSTTASPPYPHANLDMAFVAVGPSAWFITEDPGQAFALKVVALLKGEYDQEDRVYILVDPDKRLWHVTGSVPRSGA